MSPRHGLNRDVVVRAAADLMDENPARELTLANLARNLGIRTPSLYNHIGSLEELRQEIAIYAAKELADRLGSAAIGRSGHTALVAIAWAFRDFAIHRPGLSLAIQRAPEQEQTELMAAAMTILEILQRVLEPFDLSETEQIHAIRALRAMVHGFVSLEQAGGFGMPVDLDESFQYLIDIYIAQVTGGARTSLR